MIPYSDREIAELELAGAERRLELAERTLADFDKENQSRSVSVGLAQSLARERAALETEFDAAHRRRDDCRRNLAAM